MANVRDAKKAYKTKMLCTECGHLFKGTVGLATHMRKKHGLNPDHTKSIAVDKPKKSKAEKAEIIIAQKRKVRLDHGHTQAPNELYIYVGAKLEEIIHAVAYKHELVEKQFARGFFEYIRST